MRRVGWRDKGARGGGHVARDKGKGGAKGEVFELCFLLCRQNTGREVLLGTQKASLKKRGGFFGGKRGVHRKQCILSRFGV